MEDHNLAALVRSQKSSRFETPIRNFPAGIPISSIPIEFTARTPTACTGLCSLDVYWSNTSLPYAYGVWSPWLPAMPLQLLLVFGSASDRVPVMKTPIRAPIRESHQRTQRIKPALSCTASSRLPVLVLTHHRLAVIGALLRSGLAVLLNEFALHALILVGLWGREHCANTENSGCSENQTGRE